METCAIIAADHRESNGANPYLQAAVDENNKASQHLIPQNGGGQLIFKTLSNGAVGDYTILLPTRDNPTKSLIAAIFERKTWKDLAASIKDQRTLHQHANMEKIREEKGCHIYYIIEGVLAYQDSTPVCRIPFKNLQAKTRSMSIKGVHFFQTKDSEATAHFLVNISRDLARLYKQSQIHFDLQEQPHITPEAILLRDIRLARMRYLNSIPPSATPSDINTDLTKLLDDLIETTNIYTQPLETFEEAPTPATDLDILTDLKSKIIKSNMDVLMNMWCSIPKVSSKSAPVLIENIDIKDLVCNGLTILDKISSLKYQSGTSVGIKRAESIIQIAYTGDDHSLQQLAQTISKDVLSQVPMLSKNVATLILDNISLKKICQRILDKEDIPGLITFISDIKKENDRRVGFQIAERIITMLSYKPTKADLNTVS